MKRQSSLLLLLAVISLTGCTSRYDLVLRNNQTITAKSKPKEDGHGNYVYTDIEGKKTTIPASRVRSIEPRLFWANSETNKGFKFIPAN
ncbi:MAG: YgdI/YgdR family lipoprotein [Verrucomicrobia bacterium]|nr:YgdI/YgdR family lipoprotein [Verrucomicrobiota bacterium]